MVTNLNTGKHQMIDIWIGYDKISVQPGIIRQVKEGQVFFKNHQL